MVREPWECVIETEEGRGKGRGKGRGRVNDGGSVVVAVSTWKDKDACVMS